MLALTQRLARAREIRRKIDPEQIGCVPKLDDVALEEIAPAKQIQGSALGCEIDEAAFKWEAILFELQLQSRPGEALDRGAARADSLAVVGVCRVQPKVQSAANFDKRHVCARVDQRDNADALLPIAQKDFHYGSGLPIRSR